MLSSLKPGLELTGAFDLLLQQRYYETGRQGTRRNLSNGDPLIKPFAPLAEAVKEVMLDSKMSLYSRGGGPKQFRDEIIPYAEELGITPSHRPLTHQNISFGIGSTHLYTMILQTLSARNVKEHPGKKPVLLMPSPTYGIFTTQPVELGYDIETFPLREEKGWQIEPDAMSRRIAEINAEEGRRVVALYHANPHNPSGAVAGGSQTMQISRVLKKHGVFAIDDMAYAGIEHKDKAVPLAVHDFDNGATLFTLSKAYCMPRARSGVMVGPSWLVDAIDHQISVNMISLPAGVFSAAAACFSAKNRDEREEIYLPENSAKYMEHYQIIKAMVDGLDSLGDLPKKRDDAIIKAVREAYGDAAEAKKVLTEGIPQLHIMNDNPASGYFAMLKVLNLDEMFYGTKRLNNSFQFAAAAIDIGKVLTLPLNFTLAGDNCADGFRVSFGGMQEKNLARGIKGLADTIDQLPRKASRAQQAELEKSGRALDSRFEL